MVTFPVTAPTRLLEAQVDSEEDVAVEDTLVEEDKNATNVERSDTLLATVLKVVLEVTVVVDTNKVVDMVEGMAEAVAEVLVARPVSLAEDTVTCLAIALKARSVTIVARSVT
ncbi:hypothetical protein MMC30_007251 [Trapelia coarctata]|nr:hypothetical protein [Trapelia coarctata]